MIIKHLSSTTNLILLGLLIGLLLSLSTVVPEQAGDEQVGGGSLFDEIATTMKAEDHEPHGCGNMCHTVCTRTFTSSSDKSNSCKLVWKANNCNAYATTDKEAHDTCRIDKASKTIHGSVRSKFLERQGHALVSEDDDETTSYAVPKKCKKECHEVCMNTFPDNKTMQQRCMDKWVQFGCELHSGYGRRFRGKCRLKKVVQLHPETKRSMSLDR